MAYTCPRDLDGFVPHLSKPDTKFRLQVGGDLLKFLGEPSNPIVCQDIGQLIDALIPWMQSSNFKVSSNGIDVMTYLIDRLGSEFRAYLQIVLPHVIDRLGDAKDTVREKAQLLILKLLERNTLSPQALLEKLSSGFTHKNAKIREEVLRCLISILNEHGAQSITLNRFIPDIVKLLSDPTSSVRDTAFTTLVDLYKHVGDKLRMDLQKRNLVPASKWPALSARFDEVKDGGELLLTATKGLDYIDEMDRTLMAKPMVPLKKPTLSAVKSRVVSSNSAAGAGAVDEDSFLKAFEDVPTVKIFSSREVVDNMKTISDTISDPTKDWNKRVDALKKIRSLMIAGAIKHEEFYTGIKQLEIPLQTTLKDLRSQVVRESCITIAYLAHVLESRVEKTAEYLLDSLIYLIQNSAKIMATSGVVTIKIIIQNMHCVRFIPIITSHATKSKSKDIRRSCYEFLEYILNNWPTHPLERHLNLLHEAIKKGVSDADPEARVLSRKSFYGFREHFPEHGEALLQSLDPSYRRALQGDGMSASSSNNNLASGFKTPRSYGGRAVQTPHSATGSTENLSGSTVLQRAPSLPRSYRQRSGIPVLSTENSGRKGFRSNSAIDLQAAQRAKARAQYAAISRNKIASGTASLQGEVSQQGARPRKPADAMVPPSPERLGRTRSRNSQSQPTSRSGSPSSRLAYLYNRSTEYDSSKPRRLSSGIPRSTTGSRETSRETSPNRGSTLGRFRARGSDRPPMSPVSRPVLAQKILQQSREAENALADAFQNDAGDHYRSSPRKTLRSIDNHSDDSETSSVCSERSFDTYRRTSDSYSWSGSQQRLASRELWEPCRDINEIITMCASTVWQERKDGLLSLQHYMANESLLSPGELKHLTEIFTKMFMDSHTKGLSLFLDTLHEVIRSYKAELHNWTYVLLQRVFLKLGTETLNSVQSKLIATLEMIRANFPVALLMTNVYKFMCDATQTPNPKTKTLVLNFLTSLCNGSDGGQFVTSQALQKIVSFTQDGKSAELRSAAKGCLMAVWNCNTPQVAMILAELPKDQQDIALTIVHSHMRKNSMGSEPGSPMMVAGSPKLVLSPGTPPTNRLGGDGLDQEEIYRSLRKTTAEIQNYSYETLGSKLDKDTTSQDSDDTKLEELSMRATFNNTTRSGPRSLPLYPAVNGVSDVDSNGYRSLGDPNESNVVQNIIDKCVGDISNPTPASERLELLSQLLDMIKQRRTEFIIPKFKLLLRILIDNLEHSNGQFQVLVLEILTGIFKNPDMKPCWMNFVELLTLRVLQAHCDPKREVVKAAETTATAMSVCPFNTVVKSLIPLIPTSSFPTILGVLRMLTKLIETNPTEVTEEHLESIMPNLIKCTDHSESSVRKSSIFCMVAIHNAVGERMDPYTLRLMSGSKLKLLGLYISRFSANVSGGANNSSS